MVRTCRVPAFGRGLFTGNELYGWENAVVSYEYVPPKTKSKRKRHKSKPLPPSSSLAIPPVVPIDGITEL